MWKQDLGGRSKKKFGRKEEARQGGSGGKEKKGKKL